MVTQSSNRVKIDKNNPCPHCGKPDWCYMYIAEDGNLLSVCKRKYDPASGWEKSSKVDSEGTPIYYLKKEVKFSAYKEEKTQYFLYPSLGNGLRVQVYRKEDRKSVV